MGEIIKFPEKKQDPFSDATKDLEKEGITPESLEKEIRGERESTQNVTIVNEQPKNELERKRWAKMRKEKEIKLEAQREEKRQKEEERDRIIQEGIKKADEEMKNLNN